MNPPSRTVVVLWVILGVFVLVAPVYVAFAWSDTYESRHPDSASARRAGLVERGWLPPILPVSARDVREMHDLDTNRMWFCFSLPDASARNRFLARLDPIPSSERNQHVLPENPAGSPLTRLYLPAAEWWPSWLRFEGSLDATSPGVRFFTFEHFRLATRREGGDVCGWSRRKG